MSIPVLPKSHRIITSPSKSKISSSISSPDVALLNSETYELIDKSSVSHMTNIQW